MPYLCAHTRQESEAGRIVTLGTDNWEALASAHKNTPVSLKLRRITEYAASRSRHPGDAVEFDVALYPLFDAASDDELEFLLSHLQARNLIGRVIGPLEGRNYVLSADGWAAVEPTGTGGIPGRAFVAMSFDPSLDDAFTVGIHPAIELDCGMQAVRVDRVEHNEKICDRIVAEIRKAQFVVADFTLHRPGVYYEAGFAAALGRPVIWTCRKDELSKTHFDTRQYNHIDWETPGELRRRLAERIQATITASR
jgi:hypothetical protein